MKLPEQVTRLGIVLAVIVGLVLLLRLVILPESLFSARPHQLAAAEREMAKPLRHAGVAVCRECHAEQFDLKYGGKHRNIGCENCHGPRRATRLTRTPRSRRCRASGSPASPAMATIRRGPTASRRSIHCSTSRARSVSPATIHTIRYHRGADGVRGLSRSHRAYEGHVHSRAGRLHKLSLSRRAAHDRAAPGVADQARHS